MPGSPRFRRLAVPLLCAPALLVGCGGGGGGDGVIASTPTPPASSTPVTPPTDPVTPTPAPAPPPGPAPNPIDYDTAEYRRSSGVVQAHAISAYQAGATGLGVTAAIIDSGIATGSSYFAGRISPASQDVAGSRGINDTAGHGTAVAAVLGAARDGNDILGIAFDATLLVLRTDEPGSCSATTSSGDGCQHDDADIARAVDIATTNRARVINISLGGSPASSALRAAIGRATAAGVVIVISAGNDGTANPDPLALVANDAVARGLVVIAGATTSAGALASFSDQAGSGASHYIAALGDRVPSIDETGTRYLYSGTSFSAPHVAGAVALLAQAFPNLSGAQIVALLFGSANDAGAAGIDGTYGNGILNLTRAFAPQGASALAGATARVSLDDNGSLSAPMGDAGAQGSLGAVILDGYDRAYALDLARTLGHARPERRLSGALRTDMRSLSAAGGGAMVALSVAGRPDGGVAIARLALDAGTAERARVSAGMVAGRIGRTSAIAFGIARDGKFLSARLAGRSDPAFLVAPNVLAEPGFARTVGSSAAFRHQLGRLGLTVSAESGDATSLAAREASPGRSRLIRNPYTAVSVGLDRAFGPLSLALAATRLSESSSVLGARFGSAIGGAGAATWFADAEATLAPGAGWSLSAKLRRGWTRVAASGAMAGDARLATGGFSLDLAKAGVAGTGDSLALRIAQPQRVGAGGFDLSLPVSYDYFSGAVGYAVQRLGLAPRGRELDVEAAYDAPLLGGFVGANLFWRRDPGNIAVAPNDAGAALRFTVGW